ncbi:unnamed protein product [Linum trigynum]|uniref:Reverse transcriptase Ty1/copia-type domain-containing protein n=1 Tax=Linum trigynum TaxID=586398 RepID=A0AAV2E8V7_9ROSI
MTDEIGALLANQTWVIVPCPIDHPVVGSRWVYALKFLPDGTLERHKARVVAQGFSQEFGVDFDETFAPVAKMVSVRTLLAVASVRRWPLYQLDVKNAFLHGDLKETVYMELPPGYCPQTDIPDPVCLLQCSLYGLKQAPRAWFDKFHSTLLSLGFRQSQNDPSLFTRRSERVQGSSAGILLGQKKYIADLLDSTRFSDCVPVSTPMELNVKLGRETGDLLSDGGKQYRSIVGSLIYLTSTRPDIAYAVQIVAQFMSAPRTAHLAAVHRLLRYLQGTRDVGLFLPATGSLVLQAFSDSDYAGCIDTRHSTTAGVFVLVDHSFLGDARSRIRFLSHPRRQSTELCQMWYLNWNGFSDYLQILVSHVDLVRDGIIRIFYVKSEDQIADLLTKAFTASRHSYLASKLMLRDLHQFGGGC